MVLPDIPKKSSKILQEVMLLVDYMDQILDV